MIKLNIV